MGLDIIEPLLTIVAQSIPILRVLVRDRASGYESSKYVTNLKDGSSSSYVSNLKSKAERYTTSLSHKSRLSRSKLETRSVGLDDTWEQIPSPSSQNFRRRSVVALYEMEPVRPYPAVSSMLDTQFGDLKEEWAN